jgi:hypothetical protein
MRAGECVEGLRVGATEAMGKFKAIPFGNAMPAGRDAKCSEACSAWERDQVVCDDIDTRAAGEENIPQGLKPEFIWLAFGTTEVVP